jgi:hypothetical protein
MKNRRRRMKRKMRRRKMRRRRRKMRRWKDEEYILSGRIGIGKNKEGGGGMNEWTNEELI